MNADELSVMRRFDAYIKKCIRNIALNYDKREDKKWYNDVILFDNDMCFDIITSENDFENDIAEEEKLFNVNGIHINVKGDTLINALEQLNEEQRAIILLYYFNCETDAVIAEQLNSIQRTINNRRRAALKLLKSIMEKDNEQI